MASVLQFSLTINYNKLLQCSSGSNSNMFYMFAWPGEIIDDFINLNIAYELLSKTKRSVRQTTNMIRCGGEATLDDKFLSSSLLNRR